MAYARFSKSDVYVYMDVYGYLCCCMCPLEETSFHAHSTQAMIDHLKVHRESGHDVPPDIEARLLEDDAENFPAPHPQKKERNG